MVVFAQKREHDRADRRHSGGETDRRDAVLHAVELLLERGRGGIALPSIRVALRFALEHIGKLTRVAVAVGHRYMQGLVQRAVLDRSLAVGMKD